MTDQDIADACGKLFWAKDRAGQHLGFEFLEIGPGTARVATTVSAHHLNVHDTVHGSVVFSLGGSALGLACNSKNTKAVVQETSIHYTDRALEGDRIVAEAREVSAAGRTGIYDVTIRREGGGVIAMMRGTCRWLSGTHLDLGEA